MLLWAHSSARCYSFPVFNRNLTLFCYNKLAELRIIAPMEMDLLFGCGLVVVEVAFVYANGKQLGTTNDHADYSGNRFKFKNINTLAFFLSLSLKSQNKRSFAM